MRLLRIIASRRLACGCLAGVYETYAGSTVSIIDDRAPDCRNTAHRAGRRVESRRQTSVPPRWTEPPTA